MLGPELLSKFVGESEAALRRLFHKATAFEPSVLFFDEIDALCGSRGGGINHQQAENEQEYSYWRRMQQQEQQQQLLLQEQQHESDKATGEEQEISKKRKRRTPVSLPRSSSSSNNSSSNKVEERLIAQMLTELDGISSRGRVFVVGATNRPDAIDAALVRPGRLEVQVYVHLPDLTERQQIIKCGLRSMLKDVVQQQQQQQQLSQQQQQEVVEERLQQFDFLRLAQEADGFAPNPKP